MKRRGFTLVEMLTVIVIIGILASLITAAAIRARTYVREAAIKADLTQLDYALQQYKNDVGEYPPDFFGVDDRDSSNQYTAFAIDAQQRVLRHLRKAFPRYTPHGLNGGTYNHSVASVNVWLRFCDDVRYNTQVVVDDTLDDVRVDPTHFDPASALVFWLGGLPEDASTAVWKPAGFHTDQANPFRGGVPRTKTYFDFKPERIVVLREETTKYETSSQPSGVTNRYLRYLPNTSVDAPYVYFKSRRNMQSGRDEYAWYDSNAGRWKAFFYVKSINQVDADRSNVCVPYLDSPLTDSQGHQYPASAINPEDDVVTTGNRVQRNWRNPQTCQIICSGLDGFFGNGADGLDGQDAHPPYFRMSKTGAWFSQDGGDHDNITNFSDGRLENEIE